LSAVAVGGLFLFVWGEGGRALDAGWREKILFAFFPLGVSAGMVLGWWIEMSGGVFTLLSLAGFYAVHLAVAGHLPGGPWFAVFSLPGLLFLLAAFADPTAFRRRN